MHNILNIGVIGGDDLELTVLKDVGLVSVF